MDSKDGEASLCVTASVLLAPWPLWEDREANERTFQGDSSFLTLGVGNQRAALRLFSTLLSLSFPEAQFFLCGRMEAYWAG